MIKKVFQKLKGDGLTARAGRASLLTVATFGTENIIRLASNLILTRLLLPEVFGLMALVFVVFGGLKMLSDVGIKASLVRSDRGDDPDFINTAWTLQVIRGFVLSAVAALAAPYAADFYDEPQLTALISVAGLVAIFDGFIPTRIATAGRHLILGRFTYLSILTSIVVLAITILFAWWLESVWALVFGMMVDGVLRNIVFRLFMPGIPNRFQLEPAAAKELIGFGKFVFLSTLSTFLVNNADRAILGKFLTLNALGIYVIALTLASVPQTLATALVGRIIFPLYSRRKPHESAENRRKISYARFGLTAGAFFLAGLLILFGEDIVRALYDPRYDAAGAILILVVFGTLPAIMTASYSYVLLANGRSDIQAVSNISLAIFRVLLLYFAIRDYGIVGAALAPAVSTFLHYPILVYLVRPYRAWDPLHDIVFVALFGFLGFWVWYHLGDIMALTAIYNAL